MFLLVWVYLVKSPQSFDTNGVCAFEGMFVFNIIRVYVPYKKLHTEVTLPQYEYGLEWYCSNNNSNTHRLSHLVIPTEYQHTIYDI